MDHSPIPYNQYVNIGKKWVNHKIVFKLCGYRHYSWLVTGETQKKQFSRSLGVWVGTKKNRENQQIYKSWGRGGSQESPNIVFVCVCVVFFLDVFLFSHWDHPREFFKYCFFGGLLHKIILEDVAGRTWAGDHIYIHMGKI